MQFLLPPSLHYEKLFSEHCIEARFQTRNSPLFSQVLTPNWARSNEWSVTVKEWEGPRTQGGPEVPTSRYMVNMVMWVFLSMSWLTLVGEIPSKWPEKTCGKVSGIRQSDCPHAWCGYSIFPLFVFDMQLSIQRICYCNTFKREVFEE